MLGAISGYSSFFSPVSYYIKPAGGLENPVAPVVPVKAEPTATAGRSTGLIAGLSLPAMREGADPVEMAVRMRIKNAEDAENAPAAENKAAGAEEAQKALEEGECQTCKERKYQDGSDDMGVSFQTPTNVDPDLAASAVRGHEMEHVVRERAKATREDRKVVSQSVTYHTAICPECGKSYVSGGTTRTATKANPVEEPQQDQQSQNQTQNPNRTPFEAVA